MKTWKLGKTYKMRHAGKRGGRGEKTGFSAWFDKRSIIQSGEKKAKIHIFRRTERKLY